MPLTNLLDAGSETNSPRQDRLDKVRQLIAQIPVCMVNTSGLNGSIHSRPMAYLELDLEGELHFFTRVDTAKVGEVERDEQVSVTFSDPSRNLYVAVTGRARIGNDRAIVTRYFAPDMKRWFPGGQDDPALRVFTVDPDGAEYWEGLSGLTLMLDIAKASLTGASRDVGEHASLPL